MSQRSSPAYAFLLPVAADLPALDDASCILASDELSDVERAHGVQQLCLAVANGLRGQRVGRLHRHEREHLKQVVLDDVAQRPSLLVIAAAAVDTGGLGDRDLDVVDHLSRPGPLDHRVREPEDKDVLHRLLAEVMVDAEDLRLVEDLAHDATELAGARQVVPDGFSSTIRASSWRPASPMRRTIVGKAEEGVPQ